ncbi:MAG: tripartite tricarboxylate transporter permease [Thermodesulfobacteriota bacterium]|nr:tripartite tricarboxylate transporter permease [Thermodesulfobacteriota bacterium]
MLENFLIGLSIAVSPLNILFCFLGVTLGTLIGVLPGIGPVAGTAMLIPFTFGMNPTSSIIMLAGIYYGAMYGGSTTSILVNLPGESASVMTCLDGYQMARKGRAGAALGISAIGSFIAGTLSVIGLMIMAPPLANFGLRFGPPEYFSLMILGMTLVVALVGESLVKGLIACVFGILLGTVGMEPTSGIERFCYGNPTLFDGISFVSVSVGLFAVAEVFEMAEISLKRTSYIEKFSNLLPNLRDWKDSALPMLRGTVIGFFVGVMPGAGATIASMLSYATEKKLSKHPEKFGTGVIEGVAAPESANNAAAGGALIPLLTLGIPGSGTTAVLMGALLIHGLRPGPLLFEKHPDFVWAVIASMYIGNVMLLILNLPLVGIWARMLKIPKTLLIPLILAFSVVGVFTVNNNLTEVWFMLVFGFIGYFMKKFDFSPAPVVLALVLTPLMETALQQSLQMSYQDFSIFLTRPISLILLIVSIFSLFSPFAKMLWAKAKSF